MSNALGRLRQVLGDPVFVRGRPGMRPTPRAIELSVPISQALRLLHGALEPRAFVPPEARGTFSIAMTDQLTLVLLPALIRRLASEAPGIDLRVRPKADAVVFSELDASDVDLAMGVFGQVAKRFRHERLFVDDYVCVMRRGHPLARTGLTLDDYLGAKHLLVRPTGEATGHIEQVFEGRGMSRRINLIVHQYAAVPLLLAQSDMIATVFRRTAQRLREAAPLHIAKLPIPIEPTVIGLLWHRALDDHPASRWLRQLIVETATGRDFARDRISRRR
jgi:DNA-binding transcriptional LysR family regulator